MSPVPTQALTPLLVSPFNPLWIRKAAGPHLSHLKLFHLIWKNNSSLSLVFSWQIKPIILTFLIGLICQTFNLIRLCYRIFSTPILFTFPESCHQNQSLSSAWPSIQRSPFLCVTQLQTAPYSLLGSWYLWVGRKGSLYFSCTKQLSMLA